MLAANFPAYRNECNHDDLYFDKAYFGINLHPLELIFFKSIRGVANDYVDRYTDWADRSIGFVKTLLVSWQGLNA